MSDVKLTEDERARSIQSMTGRPLYSEAAVERIVAERETRAKAEGRATGWREAITDLAGGYEPGTEPQWRRWGVEWLQAALDADLTQEPEGPIRDIEQVLARAKAEVLREAADFADERAERSLSRTIDGSWFGFMSVEELRDRAATLEAGS